MLSVQLSKSEGAPGQAVHAEVRGPEAGEVAEVRLVVDEPGADIDWALQRQGDRWVMEVTVPYEAPPGTYTLSFRAYGPGHRLLDSAQAPFKVL